MDIVGAFEWGRGARVGWIRRASNAPRFYQMRNGEYGPEKNTYPSHSHICNSKEWVLASHHRAGGYHDGLGTAIDIDGKVCTSVSDTHSVKRSEEAAGRKDGVRRLLGVVIGAWTYCSQRQPDTDCTASSLYRCASPVY